MKKYLIILGGGILQIPLIKQAIEMNFTPIVFDINRKAEAFKLNDVIKILISTQNIEEATEKAKLLSKKYSIHGVLTSGTDVSQTVSSIAENLRLIGNPLSTAIATTDKITMRKVLKKNNINQPDFFELHTIDDFRKIINELIAGNIFKNGAVIKPSLNMGARGVVFISKENIQNRNIENIFFEAKKLSKNGKVIIESYIESYELSIDALIYENKIYITGIADRFIQPPPYFVENGHLMPSLLDKTLQTKGIETFKKAIKAVGINIGAAKGDIRVKYSENGKAQAYIGEIASRLSGGFMSTHTFPYSTGINLMEKIIQLHAGLKFTPPRKKWKKFSAELGIIPHKEGILQKITGINDAFYISEVKNIIITKTKGYKVIIPRNNTQKLGNIITVSSSPDAALNSAYKALKLIKPIII